MCLFLHQCPAVLIAGTLEYVLKLGNVSPLKVFFLSLFWNCYGCSSSVSFSYKFWNQLVYMYKKFCRDFDQKCTKSIEQFEGNWRVTYIKSSNPGTQYVSPFI